MAIAAKIRELRERVSGAMEDVPDNLVGTILAVTVLTVVVLGGLMFLGYRVTNP